MNLVSETKKRDKMITLKFTKRLGLLMSDLRKVEANDTMPEEEKRACAMVLKAEIRDLERQ